MELLCVLIFTIQFTTGQDTTYIDINSDIPNNVSWVLDCPAGYSELVTDFNCRESGGVDLPETDLSGQVGFWTTCVDRCDVKYVVDPADVSYKARIYQRNMLTEVFDGRRTEFIEGEGWTDFEVALGSGQTVRLKSNCLSRYALKCQISKLVSNTFFIVLIRKLNCHFIIFRRNITQYWTKLQLMAIYRQ